MSAKDKQWQQDKLNVTTEAAITTIQEIGDNFDKEESKKQQIFYKNATQNLVKEKGPTQTTYEQEIEMLMIHEDLLDLAAYQEHPFSLRYFLKTLKNLNSLRLEGGMQSTVSEDSISMNDQPEEETYGQESSRHLKLIANILRYIQQICLLLCWLTFTYFLVMNHETDYDAVMLTVPAGHEGLIYRLTKDMQGSSLYLRLMGPFVKSYFKFHVQPSVDLDKPCMSLALQEVSKDGLVKDIKSVLQLQLAEVQEGESLKLELVEKIIENTALDETKYQYQLHFYSNTKQALAIQVGYEFTTVTKKSGSIMGIILLFIIYMLIMFEMVHRTLAGVICCTLAIGIMAAIQLRPSLQLIFHEWGNIDTLMIFFGISIIIEILAETGLQDHLAAISYEYSNGHIWPMLNCLLLSAFGLSTVFDGVMLVLFLAPICLRLCEIMHLNCTPVLSCLIISINVGSCLTPISSISNNIIANSPFIPKEQYGSGIFILHMFPAAILALSQSYLHLRLLFNDSQKMRTFEPFLLIRLKHLIKIWRKASDRMGDYTLDDRLARETVAVRIQSLRKRLRRLGKMPERPLGFKENVQNLRNNFPLQKIPLLIASLVALVVFLLFSILARFSYVIYISNGWIAILAALLALSLCNYKDIEGIMARIDWSTMLFFLTLFILMQILIVLGLLEDIALMLEHFIINVNKDQRLTVAILAITWISAILTTFMDNVPVADMMMRIIGTIALNQDIDLPLMPLVWSLALGCSLGGNGSLVGAFANIACAGVASRHGYSITFFGYFKIGFFVMIGNIVVASCYLLLVHVVLQWH